MSKAIEVKRPNQTLEMAYVADIYLSVHGLFKNIFERHKIHSRRGKTMSCELSTFYMNTLNQNDKSMDPISNVASKFACWLEVSCWVTGLVSLDDR